MMRKHGILGSILRSIEWLFEAIIYILFWICRTISGAIGRSLDRRRSRRALKQVYKKIAKYNCTVCPYRKVYRNKPMNCPLPQSQRSFHNYPSGRNRRH